VKSHLSGPIEVFFIPKNLHALQEIMVFQKVQLD
jgi:hypothetical protein